MQFQNESELQGHLERCPYLLIADSEPKVKSVQREVRLPSAGILDLFLVDETGCPIAVEVKLSRNGQSRREVVAQAFDYVSDLSQITVDELDNLVDGALEQTLLDFKKEDNLWKSCGINLRAGLIKVIIAVDHVNDDLRRIVQYINEHSDLDVRLVAINKYDDGKILVPNIVVTGSSNLTNAASGKSKAPTNPLFEQVISNYNNLADDELKTRGLAKNYRQIRFDSWLSSIHYEFVDYKSTNEISVELHLESNKVVHIKDIIKSFSSKNISGKKLEWDEKWSSGRGRIRLRFSYEETPEVIANSMFNLIEETSETINEALKSQKKKCRGRNKPHT